MHRTTTILSWNGTVYFGKKYLTCELVFWLKESRKIGIHYHFSGIYYCFVFLFHYYNDNRKYLGNENCFYSRQSTDIFINDVNIIISITSLIFCKQINMCLFSLCIAATISFSESEFSIKCWCSTAWSANGTATNSTDATVAFTTVLSTAKCSLCGCCPTTGTICY